MADDPETKPEWLDRLRDLNTVIAAAGGPLMGNLFYEDALDGFPDSPLSRRYRPKRDRFRAAVRGARRMLEVGVNGCHSAFLALSENPGLEFHGVDICDFAYVKPAVGWLQAEFPGRVSFHEGDSSRVLPELAARGEAFDLFHIDGAKHLYYMDIVNASRMVGPSGGRLIVDDSNYLVAKVALGSLARFGVVAPIPEFPSMSHAGLAPEDSNNEVMALAPGSARKYGLLKSYSHVLTAARQAKAAAVAVKGAGR